MSDISSAAAAYGGNSNTHNMNKSFNNPPHDIEEYGDEDDEDEEDDDEDDDGDEDEGEVGTSWIKVHSEM